MERTNKNLIPVEHLPDGEFSITEENIDKSPREISPEVITTELEMYENKIFQTVHNEVGYNFEVFQKIADESLRNAAEEAGQSYINGVVFAQGEFKTDVQNILSVEDGKKEEPTSIEKINKKKITEQVDSSIHTLPETVRSIDIQIPSKNSKEINNQKNIERKIDDNKKRKDANISEKPKIYKVKIEEEPKISRISNIKPKQDPIPYELKEDEKVKKIDTIEQDPIIDTKKEDTSIEQNKPLSTAENPLLRRGFNGRMKNIVNSFRGFVQEKISDPINLENVSKKIDTYEGKVLNALSHYKKLSLQSEGLKQFIKDLEEAPKIARTSKDQDRISKRVTTLRSELNDIQNRQEKAKTRFEQMKSTMKSVENKKMTIVGRVTERMDNVTKPHVEKLKNSSEKIDLVQKTITGLSELIKKHETELKRIGENKELRRTLKDTYFHFEREIRSAQLMLNFEKHKFVAINQKWNEVNQIVSELNDKKRSFERINKTKPEYVLPTHDQHVHQEVQDIPKVTKIPTNFEKTSDVKINVKRSKIKPEVVSFASATEDVGENENSKERPKKQERTIDSLRNYIKFWDTYVTKQGKEGLSIDAVLLHNEFLKQLNEGSKRQFKPTDKISLAVFEKNIIPYLQKERILTSKDQDKIKEVYKGFKKFIEQSKS